MTSFYSFALNFVANALWQVAFVSAIAALGAIRQGAVPVVISDTLQEVLEHCSKTMGVGEVALAGSPSVAVPVTIGLRRPAIILPERLLAENSTELLSAAIGHEMAHIKRRDFAWNLIYELLFLPISFHPAAVLVKRRINETRELACDETVSEMLLDAKVYARSLVSLANSSCSPNHTTYILGVNDADILEERVMKLLAKQTSGASRRALALLGITLFVIALAGVVAAAFPINIRQDQDQSIPIATRFVGGWKRTNSNFRGNCFRASQGARAEANQSRGRTPRGL